MKFVHFCCWCKFPAFVQEKLSQGQQQISCIKQRLCRVLNQSLKFNNGHGRFILVLSPLPKIWRHATLICRLGRCRFQRESIPRYNKQGILREPIKFPSYDRSPSRKVWANSQSQAHDIAGAAHTCVLSTFRFDIIFIRFCALALGVFPVLFSQ